ncbi:MAG: PTS glucose transporter subunit IIA [Acholeplasmataceae bacterium]|nr:PTS glucose transporter subunit IIA [Acholeplasmataceae bacterium]
MIINYRAPILGEHFDVSKTPDDTFSNYLVGKGFVIFPKDHFIYAPIDGIITHIFPTKHIIVITHDSGINLMIHLGLESGILKGEGINLEVKLNQKVQQGDLVMSFDYDYLKEKLTSLVIPVVFIQKNHLEIIESNFKNSIIELLLNVD